MVRVNKMSQPGVKDTIEVVMDLIKIIEKIPMQCREKGKLTQRLTSTYLSYLKSKM